MQACRHRVAGACRRSMLASAGTSTEGFEVSAPGPCNGDAHFSGGSGAIAAPGGGGTVADRDHPFVRSGLRAAVVSGRRCVDRSWRVHRCRGPRLPPAGHGPGPATTRPRGHARELRRLSTQLAGTRAGQQYRPSVGAESAALVRTPGLVPAGCRRCGAISPRRPGHLGSWRKRAAHRHRLRPQNRCTVALAHPQHRTRRARRGHPVSLPHHRPLPAASAPQRAAPMRR